MRNIIWLLAIILGMPLVLCDWQIYNDGNVDEEPYYWTGYWDDMSRSALKVNNYWGEEAQDKGGVCTQIIYDISGGSKAELYVQRKEGDWRRGPYIGNDFSGSTDLVFWARGENGLEQVTFGLGYPNDPEYSGWGDSSQLRIKETLTNYWKEYNINLRDEDLTHINAPFYIKIEQSDNNVGATFYLDNITYVNQTDGPEDCEPIKAIILEPVEDKHVEGVVYVEGRLSRDLCDNEFVWIAVKPLKAAKDWWPQNNGRELVPVNKEFNGNAYLNGDNGDKFEIAILVVDEELHNKFLNWMNICIAQDDWPSITSLAPGRTDPKVPKEEIDKHKVGSVKVILDK